MQILRGDSQRDVTPARGDSQRGVARLARGAATSGCEHGMCIHPTGSAAEAAAAEAGTAAAAEAEAAAAAEGAGYSSPSLQT